jgi:hypothetical protein
MAKQSSLTRPVEDGRRKKNRFWHRIRNILVVCGALVALVGPVVLANTCSGQDSAEEEKPESQLFATNSFDLQAGLAIVEMTHQGEGDFVVDLLPSEQEGTANAPERIEFFGDQNGGSEVGSALALADEKGSADISRAVNISDAGKHVFDVKADGPWTIQVEQPHPSSAPEPAKFSGDDDTATPLFQLSSGLKEITATNPAGGKLDISLLDEDGSEVGRIPEDKAGQAEDPPATLSSTIDIQEAGIYLFDVRADSLWTVEISDAG